MDIMGKKISLIVIGMIMLLALNCISIQAATGTLDSEGKWYYVVLEDGTAKLTGCTGFVGTVVVPDMVDGYTVTTIAEGAIWNKETDDDDGAINRIEIPATVENIEDIQWLFNGNYGGEGLESISISEDNSTYCMVDNVLFSADKKTLIYYWTCERWDDDEKESRSQYTIPDTVTRVESRAFLLCEYINTIEIPESVEYIGSNAFGGCTLQNIVLDANNKCFVVADGVLYTSDMKKLILYPVSQSDTEYEIPNGVTIIEGYAFANNNYIEKIVIPDSVTNIGDHAFADCKNLSLVNIPEGVTQIDACTFLSAGNHLGLKVILPNTLKSIGISAFSGASLSMDFQLPEGLISIGDYAFQYSGAKSIVIPSSVETIGDYAFYECNDLKELEIQDGVKTIGTRAFWGAYGIKSVELPASVSSIAPCAFGGGCYEDQHYEPGSFEAYYVDVENPYYCSINGVLYTKDKSCLVAFPEKNSDASIIDWEGVKSVADRAFYGSRITKLEIPSGVEKVGNYAFEECDLLTNITFGSDVLEIGEAPFSLCCYNANLHNITILNKMVKLDRNIWQLHGNLYANENDYESDEEGELVIGHRKMYGYKGSTAQAFAEANGYEFVCLQCENHTLLSSITKVATCTVDGEMLYTCKDCDYTKTERIPATGHNLVEDMAVVAGMRADGKTAGSHCGTCGEIIVAQQVIPKIAAIKLSKSVYTYNGKTKNPTVSVTDSMGNKILSDNYDVKYPSKSKSVGIYTVKITFKGAYSGEKELVYRILPKATSISKLVAKKKGFTLKWKKNQTQTTGYQIQYATNKSFKNAKTILITKNKTTSKTFKKLKAKKTYYVRMRTYKTVKSNGKSVKLYSSWSNVKKIKTKK